MQKITPFLWFDDQAEEAMRYYVSAFSGAPSGGRSAKIVSIKRYPDGPLEGPMKGMEGRVLTGVFELDGLRFYALDGGPHFKFTEAISLHVECESQEEVDYFWRTLGAGGDPQAQQCGWLKDRYGLSWQIVPKVLPALLSDPDAKKSGRVMQALLQMKKLDIALLERAFHQEDPGTTSRAD
jgi:predicted 3-demethylubiquinone-9 3-methyltransferase (glyoxalase superfamily)